MLYLSSPIKKFLIALVFVTSFFVAAQVHAADYMYKSSFGSSGSSDGQFNTPTDVVLDSSGNIYVVDSSNNRIQKFNSSRTQVSQFGSNGSGDGEFSYPQGIAVDASNNLYVVDNGNNRIQKFDSSGAYVSQFGTFGTGDGEFNYPRDVAVDASGNIYVADTGNNRIQKFDSSGAYVSQFGSTGWGDGQFGTPRDITLDASGNIYVADSSNNRIQKFDSSGAYVSQFGTFGSGNGEFISPQGVAVDASGNIYVSDTGNNRIQQFDSSGIYVSQFGSTGSGDGQFNVPEKIIFDAQGNLIIADSGNNRIVEFELAPYLSQWSFTSGKGIASDVQGNIYVLGENNSNMVAKYDSEGNLTSSFIPSGTSVSQLNDPHGIVVDSAGNIFVLDKNGYDYTIKKFSYFGAYVTSWGSSGSGDGQFGSASAIAIDGVDNIYVADLNRGDVQKFTNAGVFISKFNTSGQNGLAVDKQGNVYVSNVYFSGVYKYSPQGTYISQISSVGSGDGAVSSPTALSVDTEGGLYVLDNGNHRVQKFNSSGSYVTKFGSEGTGNGEFGYDIMSSIVPQGIAQNPLGFTYVVDTVNNRVQKFRSTVTTLPLVSATVDQGSVYLNFAEDIDTGTFQMSISDFAASVNGSTVTFTSGALYDGNTIKLDLANPNIVYGDEVTITFTQGMTVVESGVSDKVFASVQSMLVKNTIAAIEITQTGYSANQNQTAVTLSWSTNYNSNAVISYGSASVGENSVSVSNGSTAGTVTITGLSRNTVYKYQITVTQAGTSNTAQTAEKIFITNYLGVLPTSIPSPRGVAVNSVGDIYVIDGDNSRVRKLDQYGNQLLQFGSLGSGNGQFSNPYDIAIDASDNVYVSDTGNNRIQKFNSSGAYQSQFGAAGSGNSEFSNPKGMTIDSGYLYVADSGNNRVQILNVSDGGYYAQFGTAGSGDAQFSNPSDVGVYGYGNIYVIDTGNNRVQRLYPGGGYQSQFGVAGSGDGQFSDPSGILIDPNLGYVYVVDAGNHRIQKFNSDGVYQSQFGAYTAYGGQLNNPQSLAFALSPTLGAVGDLLVANTANGEILRFGEDATPPTLISAEIDGNTLELTFDEVVADNSPSIEGFVVNVNGTPRTINNINVSGSKIFITLATAVTPQDTITLTYTPGGVADVQDPRGNYIHTGIIVGTVVSNVTINVYYVSTVGIPGSAGSGNSELSGPEGVAVDNSNNLYVVDYGNNRVQKFNSSGVYQSQFGSSGSGDGEFSQPLNVAINGSGDMYVSDVGNNRVQKFNSSGAYQSQIGGGDFSELRKIAVDSYGIHVTDTGNNRIRVYNQSDNSFAAEFGSSGEGTGQFNSPVAIAFDSQGNAYVLDAGNSRIQKFSNGMYTYITSWGTSGSAHGQFSSPTNIYIDQADNIYVIDAGNSRIQKFNTSGVYKGKWAYTTAGDTYVQDAKSIAIDSDGYMYVSDGSQHIVKKLSFTVPADVTAPGISNIATSTVSDTSITIAWDTNESASSTVEYGLTSSYTNATTSDTLVTNHSMTLTGLMPGQTYHFRVGSSDASGNVSSSSDDLFTMPDTTGPVISSIASSTTQTTTIITWNTDEAATSTVNYGLSSSYGTASSSPVGTSSLATTSHRIILSSLTPDTTYHFQISSRDDAGNLATSSDLTFTTLDATTLSPTLLSPTAGTYTNTSPMSVSFVLPETPLTSSIRLTYTPSVGTPIVLNLRDAAPSVTNTFSLPLTSGITTTVTEVLSATADSIPVDTYSVTLSYQDQYNNPAASATVTGIVVAVPVVVTPSGGGSSGGWSGATGGSSGGSSSYYSPVIAPVITPVIATSTIVTTIVATSTNIATSTVLFKFTRDLILNNIHPEVLQLQKFLNAKGYTVAKTGPGSVGKETTKFGSATKAALIKFQRANKIPGTGFFGPVTRAFVNKMK